MSLINLAVVAILAATLVCNASTTTIDYLNPVRSAQEDEVKHLPCFANHTLLKSKHYSGYLKAHEDGEQELWLHYWFVESESNPTTDPVLLWLNGGPGASSLGALSSEIGPFQFDKNSGTIFADNKFSWSKLANVLYLESPVGVGFSYSNGPLKVQRDDITTARSNHIALQNFMQKFPQFSKNPFYMSGISYAGTYLASLGTLIDQDEEFNLKGIAIENGLLDSGKQNSSRIFYAYYHGLIGKKTWEEFSNACCDGRPPTRGDCSSDNSLPDCNNFLTDFYSKFHSKFGAMTYNILYNHHETLNLATKEDLSRVRYPSIGAHSAASMWTVNKTIDDPWKHSNVSRCLEINFAKYLNNQSVRDSIHIPQGVDQWLEISKDIYETYITYYPELSGGLTTHFRALIESPHNLTMLVYNGDLDMVCDFLGTRWFVEDLGREVISDYQPWIHDGRVAGFVQHFEGITFATVRGAGHAASLDRPKEGFAIIEHFLNAKGRNVEL